MPASSIGASHIWHHTARTSLGISHDANGLFRSCHAQHDSISDSSSASRERRQSPCALAQRASPDSQSQVLRDSKPSRILPPTRSSIAAPASAAIQQAPRLLPSAFPGMLRSRSRPALLGACSNQAQDNEACPNTGTYQGEHKQRRTFVGWTEKRHVVLLVLHGKPLLGHVAALCMDKEPVRIHAVGRAGDKRHEVLSLLCHKALRLGRKHHLRACHTVGMVLSQNTDYEPVAFLETVDIAQDLGGRKARMACKDTMGGRSSDRKRRGGKMPYALEERLVGNAVIDGQVHPYGGNDELPHDTIARKIEDAGILFIGRRGIVRIERIGYHHPPFKLPLVECTGSFPFRRKISCRNLRDNVFLAHTYRRLLLAGEIVACVGIEDGSYAGKCQQNGCHEGPYAMASTGRRAGRGCCPFRLSQSMSSQMKQDSATYLERLRLREATRQAAPRSATPPIVRAAVPASPVTGSRG